MPRVDPESNRQYQRELYARNRDRVLARQRAYYAENRKSRLAAAHVREAASPDVSYAYWLGGDCVYVGSGRIRRARTHKTKSVWYRPEMVLVTYGHPSSAHARKHEYEMLIEYYEAGHPLLNKDGIRGLERKTNV